MSRCRRSVRIAFSIPLILRIVAPVQPVVGEERAHTSQQLDRNDPASGAGPLTRAATLAAIRLASEVEPTAIASESATPNNSDWSRVARITDGEIILSLRGSPREASPESPSRKRTIVPGTVSQSGMTVINLIDPAIPSELKKALAFAASQHPEYFTEGTRRGAVRLGRHARLENGTVLMDDGKAFELESLIERIDRNDVAEVSRVHRATKVGAGWGALLGEGIAVAEMFARCGTNWSTTSCGNLAGLQLLVYPIWGALAGAALGAATEITTVVYRAP